MRSLNGDCDAINTCKLAAFTLRDPHFGCKSMSMASEGQSLVIQYNVLYALVISDRHVSFLKRFMSINFRLVDSQPTWFAFHGSPSNISPSRMGSSSSNVIRLEASSSSNDFRMIPINVSLIFTCFASSIMITNVVNS